MRPRAGIVGIVCVSVLLGGCGGGTGSGGSVSTASTTHTYVVAPQLDAFGQHLHPKGLYITLVSPVPIPARFLTKRGNKIVSHAKGPQRCSFTKTARNLPSSGAFLNGKRLTFKVNGTNSLTGFVCQIMKSQPLDASSFMGG